MSFLINPYAYASAGGGVTIGNTLAVVNDISLASGFQQGFAVQAAASGTLNKMFLRGSTASNQTVNWRLCIYAATSATSWGGALLAQTADQTDLNQNEVRELSLLVPLVINSGNWYALTVHAGSNMNVGSSGGNDRAFGDAYADGPAATAGASGANSGTKRECLWATT